MHRHIKSWTCFPLTWVTTLFLTETTTSIVPIRIHLDRNLTPSQSLKMIQDQALSTAAFEETDLVRIGSVCTVQTILVVQPDPLRMIPTMSSQWQMLYDRGNLSRIPLTVECELHGESMDISLRHNSRMDRNWEPLMLDRLVSYWELIDLDPSRLIGELSLA